MRHLAAVAREVVPSSAPAGERAAAISHLLGLLSAGIDLLAHRADPRAPLLTRWMTETRKIFGDSPDTIYTTAPVDNAAHYRLAIRPGNCVYWSAVVYAKDRSGNVRIVSACNDIGLSSAPGGSHEIRLGGPAADVSGESWMPLEEGSFWVMVREYFDGEERNPADLRIEVLDAGPAVAVPDLSSALAGLTTWVGSAFAAERWLFDLSAQTPNAETGDVSGPIPEGLVTTFLPTPDIAYQGCVWDLADDQALLIDFAPPTARYWAMAAMNRWMESLDARVGRNCVNSRDAVPEAGGSVRIVVSSADPGHPNWLPTQGNRRGMLSFRALLLDGPEPDLQYSVVQVSR